MDPDKGIDTLIESFLEAFLTGQNNICPINFYSEEAIVSINSRIPDQKATFCLTPADANSATQRWNPGNYIDIVYDCLYTNYSDDKAVEWTCFSCSGFIEFKDLVTTEPLFFSRTFLLSRQPNSCYVIENDIFTVAPIEFQISEAKRAAASNALEILLAVEANQAPSANTTSESLNNNNVEQPTLPTDDDEITVSGTTRQIISESSSKNPISILAEYAQRKKISLEFKEGQHEMGRFVIEAVLGGKESFSGYGKKKKTAKTNAALLAIEALVSSEQLQASVAKILTLPPDTVEASPGFGNDEGDAEVTVSGTTLQMISESGGKNPISLLAEYSQRKKISLEFREGRDERDRFICQVVLSEEVFSTGCGRNKKSAKTNAALLALETLVSSEEFQAPTPQQLAKRTLTTPKFHTDSMFGHVASWSHKVFEEICSRTPEAIDSGKVIAGLVMWDSEERKGFVLSVGTGNRCVKGDFLSTSGEIVNDCHAEIITMRGFKRVMYSQIEAFLRVLANPDKVNSTMLEQSPKANGKLALRPRFSFHLYINTAPCGDGRVFTLSEPDDALGDPDDPNTHVPVLKDPKKHGILRTKIEKGEGTIPIYDQEIQTLDGINGGERLRTMSCSDKILKWNVLGIQGALLSAFIEPIYLASVTIGTLSHHGHLTRAMCCRLQDMNPLPDSFALNHPLVGTAGVSAGRDTSKSTALSVNWNYADQCEELIDGTTGKLNYNRKSSRLCKKEFFNLFTHVAKLSGCASTDELDTSYIKAKSTFASKYVQAQIQMKQYCHKQNMGNWLSKPIEEKMFGL